MRSSCLLCTDSEQKRYLIFIHVEMLPLISFACWKFTQHWCEVGELQSQLITTNQILTTDNRTSFILAIIVNLPRLQLYSQPRNKSTLIEGPTKRAASGVLDVFRILFRRGEHLCKCLLFRFNYVHGAWECRPIYTKPL